MNKRFGRLPIKSGQGKKNLLFKNYTENLPIPDSINNLITVSQKLGITDIPTLFPMDGNDTYGDCTIAGLAHLTTIYKGLTGILDIPATTNVTALYFQLTGGQDSGLNELDVLTYWQKNNPFDDTAVAFVSIDPLNHNHVKQAITLFGGVYTGFNVQQNAISDFDACITWTPGTLTNDGHCVPVGAYDANTVTVLTWGNKQLGTWAWWDDCVDECYAIIPLEAFQYTGINLALLKSDLAAIGNEPIVVLKPHKHRKTILSDVYEWLTQWL